VVLGTARASIAKRTLVAVALASALGRGAAGAQDWPRFGWNVGRSSAPAVAMGITAANVASLERQQVTLDGTVDASAIYLHHVAVHGDAHDVVFVTTTYGKTIAIDADHGTVLWEYTPSSYAKLAGSYQVTTTTPVADPDRRFIYAASPDGAIQKLAVSDGHVVWRTAVTRLARREKLAAPLNIFRGRVIPTTGGYIGDAPPYQGHVAILDAETGALLHVWNSLCSDRHELLDPSLCPASGSAIWGRAGAVIDSVTGTVYVATGNGPWDGHSNWGDAVIALDADVAGIVGNYTPENTEELDARDADLGSTAPVLLGGGLVAQGGKDGKIRLLDWPALRTGVPHRGGEVEVVSTPSGSDLFTAVAVLRTDSVTRMFAADNGGTAAWTVSPRGLDRIWHNGHAGTSPVVVDGLVFVYDPAGGLRVYEAVFGRPIATLECGPGHWNSPIIAAGRIVLPEGNSNDRDLSGVLDIWRVP
jgi:outer membrane protein assembly factor BamB